MERPLNGKPKPSQSDANDKRFKTTTNLSAVLRFLNKHEWAKILIIVNTHSLENGCFVYKGDRPQDFEACSLLEVRSLPHRAVLALPPSSAHIHTHADSKGLYSARGL